MNDRLVDTSRFLADARITRDEARGLVVEARERLGSQTSDPAALAPTVAGILRENAGTDRMSTEQADAAAREILNRWHAAEFSGQTYQAVDFPPDQLRLSGPPRTRPRSGAEAASMRPPTMRAEAERRQSAPTIDLRQEFIEGQRDHIYTQNFGLVDRHHVEFWAAAYLQVYQAAQQAAATGQPQTVTITPGGNMTGIRLNYQLQPGPGQDIMRMAREICADASVRYEDHTDFGAVNTWLQDSGLPFGSSAYSTEDLPSNALGMAAGEAYVRQMIANPNDARSVTAEQRAQLRQDVTDRSGRVWFGNEAARDAMLGWVFAHAGTLHTDGEAAERGVERVSFGSRDFLPETTDALGRPDPAEQAIFRQFERESRERGGRMSGQGSGWALQDSSAMDAILDRF